MNIVKRFVIPAAIVAVLFAIGLLAHPVITAFALGQSSDSGDAQSAEDRENWDSRTAAVQLAANLREQVTKEVIPAVMQQLRQELEPQVRKAIEMELAEKAQAEAKRLAEGSQKYPLNAATQAQLNTALRNKEAEIATHTAAVGTQAAESKAAKDALQAAVNTLAQLRERQTKIDPEFAACQESYEKQRSAWQTARTADPAAPQPDALATGAKAVADKKAERDALDAELAKAGAEQKRLKTDAESKEAALISHTAKLCSLLAEYRAMQADFADFIKRYANQVVEQPGFVLPPEGPKPEEAKK